MKPELDADAIQSLVREFSTTYDTLSKKLMNGDELQKIDTYNAISYLMDSLKLYNSHRKNSVLLGIRITEEARIPENTSAKYWCVSAGYDHPIYKKINKKP